MQLAHLFRSSALAALAATLTFSILPAEAIAQERMRSADNARENIQRPANRGQQLENRQRANRANQQSNTSAAPAPIREARQEARQIDRRSEARAANVEARGDRAARRLDNLGNQAAARQVDRRSEARAQQIEERGDQRARETMREARREVAQDRFTRTERNAAYVNTERNRTYSSRERTDYRDNDRNRGNWDRRENNRGNDWNRRENNRGNDWNRDRNGSYRDGYRDARRDYRRWNRNDWRRDNRYNWNHYRSSNRNIYRLGRYYSPYRNYSYNRLSIGFYLDSVFFGSRYWINDPWQYRLPDVYGPYRWVRYFDDVMLVDVYTGEVVDVIYDFFW